MSKKLDYLLWRATYWVSYFIFAIAETVHSAIKSAWEDAWN